ITALEAIACKTPVVTLKHPMNAVVDLIDEMGFGVYVERQKLADAVLSLLKNEIKLGFKKDIDEYSWDNVAKKIEKVYENFDA
ncbi:MAG: hypothetical protein J7K36_07225, partial [Archaeoglobaceae archaeon]|nr:hypothetical protein [Archaeoglobaceae archaeon]